MQEKTSPVFVVATANDVSALPPEFLRKGRFDEMFFVDLPGKQDREAIWRIVVSKYGRDPEAYDIPALAAASERFTGAEIEAVFLDALHDAFARSSEPQNAVIAAALERTVPLARLMSERISALRQWARGRARDAGSGSSSQTPPAKPPRRNGRKVAALAN